MDFIFQGFQSNLPVWLYFLLLPITTALSWWSYKDLTSISSIIRYALITVRSLVFLILLVLLINPFYKAEQTYLEKPEIMVLWDNSESTTIRKGNYEGKKSYQKVIEELQLKDSSEVSYRSYAMGGSIEPADFDSLNLNSTRTNIYNAVEAIRNREKDLSGAILLTDGIFNQGRNPVYEAGNLAVPVMTVALGDTVEQKDLVVEEINTSNTGYVQTLHSVEARVSANGFAGQSFQVQLKKGPEVLQQQTINPTRNRSSHTLNYELNLEEEGLQQFEIVIPKVESEWTGTNNSQSFAIDVLNEKQRILSLAFEIHPDVKALRSLLLQDQNTSLIPRTWIGNDRFIEGSLEVSADTLELLILHGFPGQGLPDAIESKITELAEQLPAIMIATPGSNFGYLEQISDNMLPVSYSETGDFQRINLLPNVEPTAHPIMELPDVSYDIFPPIRGPLQNSTTNPGAEILFVSSFQGADTQRPLIAISEIGNLRRTQISGYNWYRFALNNDQQVQNYWQQLFSNIISWTATKPDNRKLKIQPSQKVFTGTEPIVLNAYLTNESGEIVSDGTIDIELSGEEIDTRFYSMTNSGNGQYILTINALPQGIYHYSATARKGNRTIDSQQGELSVNYTNTEFVNTNRNESLLKQISSVTGGSYFAFSDLTGFTDSLKEKGMLTREEKVNSTLFYPYQHSFWFILVIALLTTEWITRKYYALS